MNIALLPFVVVLWLSKPQKSYWNRELFLKRRR